jgi:curli biogenesis system outer membrane secretion channel CsgG
MEALMQRQLIHVLCMAVVVWTSTLRAGFAGQSEPLDPLSDRPTLAIVDFETKPAGSILPPPGLGSAMAELMLDCLVTSGKYRVIDGRWAIQRREHISYSAQVDAMKRYLQEASVDYVLLGSMQRFTMEDRRRVFGGGAIVPMITGVRRNKTELAVGITVRVVDARSGEIATTATAQSAANRKQVSLGLLGLFRHGGGGGFSKGTSGSRDAMLDEAMRQAVATAAQEIINAASRLKRSF